MTKSVIFCVFQKNSSAVIEFDKCRRGKYNKKQKFNSFYIKKVLAVSIKIRYDVTGIFRKIRKRGGRKGAG